MSIRGLSLPCPECGDTGAFFLVKDEPEWKTFSKGYACGVCGHYWEARFQDKLDHPDEYIPYSVREEVNFWKMPEDVRLKWSREWLTLEEQRKKGA